MKTSSENYDELKTIVKKKYAQISRQPKTQNSGSCCGVDCGCSTVEYSVFAKDYTRMSGYNEAADLGLGCGLPTEFAHISNGDTVVDLGSGAGNDCFIARQIAGASGRIIGLDMTEEMIEKARENASAFGYGNMEFVLGDIESMPLDDIIADVVVSNCVLNLVPDKQKAFAETFRILKPGGHFSISDVVTIGELPEALKKDAELYAGCVAGAIGKEEYLTIIDKAGFVSLMVQKERAISLPDEILENYLSGSERKAFKESGIGIFSITVYAEKPL